MSKQEEVIKFELPKVLKDVMSDFIDAEYERRSMINFIRENAKDSHHIRMDVPKHIRKRYGIYPNRFAPGLAWYLLDEYFKGNITIKTDAQPEP